MEAVSDPFGARGRLETGAGPVEIYRLTLQAVGVTPKAELARHAGGGRLPEPAHRRPVRFDEEPAPIDTPVYSREELPAGATIVGPAIVDQLDSTTVIPPGVHAEIDDWLNIRIAIGEASQ